MSQKSAKEGRRARSPDKAVGIGSVARSISSKGNSEASLGAVIASCRRRGGIGTVFKTLGMGKVEPSPHVNVGKEQSSTLRRHRRTARGDAVVAGEQTSQRMLGVSLLGGCSSKGSPTKSVENEDRYVHGKINVEMETLRGLGQKENRSDNAAVPCWAFAAFDGHAGPVCAHFLKENFMKHLTKTARARRHAAVASQLPAAEGNADAAAGKAEERGLPEAEGALPASPVIGDEDDDSASPRKAPTVEVVLARLLTDTLASLTRAFEKDALLSGEISGACVIAGLYCHGALVLANIGDCQAVYHGEVKSAPGTAVTAQTTIHDASNPAEVNRFLMAGGFMSSTGRFQGVLEPSRTVGDVDVKAEAPKGCIASYPELFKVDIASEVSSCQERLSVPPFLVLATDGIWDETSATTVVEEVKDGIAKIQAHKRRFAVSEGHRRDSSIGSTTFTDGESDSEDEESEFCGSGEWAEQGMDLAERVVSLARGRYDDATALVVVFE